MSELPLRAGGREVAAGPFDTRGTSSSTASAGLRLGADGALSGGYCGGRVAEVFVYQRVLTSGEIARVQDRLRRRYRLEPAG